MSQPNTWQQAATNAAALGLRGLDAFWQRQFGTPLLAQPQQAAPAVIVQPAATSQAKPQPNYTPMIIGGALVLLLLLRK